ncbi:gas vesicle protein GvpJ [Actinomadura chibensis]|uniref:gas vesicle protein GvpJ n=1 Tax=Actinomadura chibensis TaxID=392828 RepID=UPI00082D699C
MSEIPWTGTPSTARSSALDARAGGQPANLADLLERILDKGIVIVGDIRVNLLDIELLTIKLRLLVASVDRAKEMGIDWWEHDPSLSSKARRDHSAASAAGATEAELAEENRRLRERLAALESGDTRPRDEQPRLEQPQAEHAQPQPRAEQAQAESARNGQAPDGDGQAPDGQSSDGQSSDGQDPDERDPDERARDEPTRQARGEPRREEKAPRTQPRGKEQGS